MRSNIPEIVFISAFNSNLSADTNSRRNELLYAVLSDLNVRCRQCEGHYKGDKELTFMVFLDHNKGFNEKFFANIAFEQFNQESILYRDKYKEGFLIFNNGEGVKNIGQIVELTPEEASKQDSFTRFPLTDRYLGVKHV